MAEGGADLRDHQQSLRPVQRDQREDRGNIRSGRHDTPGLERQYLQHGPEPVRKRHRPHRRDHPGLCNDPGADPPHRGPKQPQRCGYLDLLQVDLQNRRGGADRDQHLEHRYGRVRCGPKRGEQRLRGHCNGCQHRLGGSDPGPGKQTGGDGGWPVVRAMVPIPVCEHHDLGVVHCDLHRDLWPYDRDLPGNVCGSHPYGDHAQPRYRRRHGAKLPAFPVRLRLPGISYHRLCGDICGAGAEHSNDGRHQRGDLDLYGLYGSAVLYAV